MSKLVTKNSDRSTGPRTQRGKAVSSQNATTHGLCSKTIVLPNESEAQWETLRASWLSEYEYPNQAIISLAEQTARAEWLFNRATARYNEAEQALYREQPDPVRWTDEQHKLLERFTRYRTTLERSFHRSLNLLNRMEESYCKARVELARTKAEHAELSRKREEAEARLERMRHNPKSDLVIPSRDPAVTGNAQKEPDPPVSLLKT